MMILSLIFAAAAAIQPRAVSLRTPKKATDRMPVVTPDWKMSIDHLRSTHDYDPLTRFQREAERLDKLVEDLLKVERDNATTIAEYEKEKPDHIKKINDYFEGWDTIYNTKY